MSQGWALDALTGPKHFGGHVEPKHADLDCIYSSSICCYQVTLVDFDKIWCDSAGALRTFWERHVPNASHIEELKLH